MRRILVAGIGNVFYRDDAFGVEVVRRLGQNPVPPGTTVLEVGIRGLHLAFELLEPWALLILVDSVEQGHPPGTLHLIEPDPEEIASALATPPYGHGLEIAGVFAATRALGGRLPPIRILGCEPATLDEGVGLSPDVEAAIGPAVRRIHALLRSRPARSPKSLLAGQPSPQGG